MTTTEISRFGPHVFTDEDRAKAVAKRRETRDAMLAERAHRDWVIRTLSDGMSKDDIVNGSYAMALELVRKVAAADVPIRTSLDMVRAMQAAEAGIKIARLLSNESTSNVAVSNLSPSERAQLMADVQARAAALDVSAGNPARSGGTDIPDA